jgi:hypothetical protein
MFYDFIIKPSMIFPKLDKKPFLAMWNDLLNNTPKITAKYKLKIKVMKTTINKLKLSILVISLASTTVMAQIPRDSVKVDTIKTQKVASKMDTVKTKMDSTRAKIATKINNVTKDVKVAVEKKVDEVTPSKPTEMARVSTPTGNVTLTADPTLDGVFHKGSLVIGAGIVYQKDLIPLMLMGEYGILRNIGVELRGWYGSKTTDGVQYRDGLLSVGLNYHFTGDVRSSSSKFDAYVGGLYGKILDQTGSAFYAQAGARYFLIGRLGAFGNFNLGLIGSRGTNLSIGLAYTLF